jgi:hypothetical protein
MTKYNMTDKLYNSFVDVSRGEELGFAQVVSYGDNPLFDAFGRIRSSYPESIFDNYEIDGKKPLFWSESHTGTVVCTHVANQSCIQFAASMTSGNKVTRSSRRLSLYTPGTSLMALCTGVMGTGQTGSSERIGLFDAKNGIFAEQKDKVMGFVIRTYTSGTASDNRVDQSDWNIDTMDGNGHSGIDLDFTKTQIYFIDLEWLGVGRVRCGFVHEGKLLVAHEFYHNNRLSTVYMKTPLLPIRYEIENRTAVSTALTDFRQICCAIQREGGESTTHKHRNVNNGYTAIPVTTHTTAVPIISLKIQDAYIGQGMIKPDVISLMSMGTKDMLFEVIYNGTVEGGTFVTASSGIGMYNVTATNCTGGTRIAAQYSSSNDKLSENIFDKAFWLGGSITGTADTLTVIARAISGLTGSVVASIDYKEVY